MLAKPLKREKDRDRETGKSHLLLTAIIASSLHRLHALVAVAQVHTTLVARIVWAAVTDLGIVRHLQRVRNSGIISRVNRHAHRHRARLLVWIAIHDEKRISIAK